MTTKTHDIWNHRFMHQIIDSMVDGVFIVDPKGMVTFWNPPMEKISGYPAREAMGKPCTLIQCNQCFGRECPNGIESCGILEHGLSETRECILRHKDGYDVPIIKKASVVKSEHGEILGIVEAVTDLTELKQARQKAEEATFRLGEVHRMDNIIGKSQVMHQVYAAINAAASSNTTIIIQGESGTGKELVAGAIHYNSGRRNHPLITVNCSALSEQLLESELFGHVKGSYTGAIRDRIGRFEEAQGGTIFLDEIGELSPYIQVKLLRVLQERELERVGESRKRKIDIRVITATHRNLQQLVREGLFREDLYYRLKVFPINLPALQKRKEDIPLLASHFISSMNEQTGKQIQGLSPLAIRALMDYHWPGNIRELENAIEHAFVICDSEQIQVTDLPIDIRIMEKSTSTTAGTSETTGKRRKKASLTKDQLWQLLTESGWNKLAVGRKLGISHTAIWKYMKKWEIPLKKPEKTPPD